MLRGMDTAVRPFVLRLATIFAAALPLCSEKALGTDWLTLPSTYSHDAATGERVAQYAPIQGPTTAVVENFRTSGYTHTRSTLNYGQSADNYHRVEQWGDPVRPYGEWRFPFRPFSAPYQYWGAPLAGLNLGFPGAGFPNTGFQGRGLRNPLPRAGDQPATGSDSQTAPTERLRESDRWPLDRNRGLGRQPFQGQPFQGQGFQGQGFGSGLNPYPISPNSPYPVAPYYDGYYPNYRD